MENLGISLDLAVSGWTGWTYVRGGGVGGSESQGGRRRRVVGVAMTTCWRDAWSWLRRGHRSRRRWGILLAEAEQCGVCDREFGLTTASWLAHVTHGSRPVIAGQVKTAVKLRRLEVVDEALATGPSRGPRPGVGSRGGEPAGGSPTWSSCRPSWSRWRNGRPFGRGAAVSVLVELLDQDGGFDPDRDLARNQLRVSPNGSDGVTLTGELVGEHAAGLHRVARSRDRSVVAPPPQRPRRMPPSSPSRRAPPCGPWRWSSSSPKAPPVTPRPATAPSSTSPSSSTTTTPTGPSTRRRHRRHRRRACATWAATRPSPPSGTDAPARRHRHLGDGPRRPLRHHGPNAAP